MPANGTDRRGRPRNAGASSGSGWSGWPAGCARWTSMTDAGYTTVTPVFTVSGQRNGGLGRDCIRLEISEGIEGLRTLQAYFLAVRGSATGPPNSMLHLDGADVDLGRELKVTIGPQEGQRQVFEG